MTTTVADLSKAGVISWLDAHFAAALGRLVPSAPDEVLLGAALASRAVGAGHVCADLTALDVVVPDDVLPAFGAWVDVLSASPLVGTGAPGEPPRPLVLAGGRRLYLQRYHRYETRLAASLLARATVSAEVDEDVLRESLARLFDAPAVGTKPGRDGSEQLSLFERAAGDVDRQRLAAAMAVLRRFAVISGGPGTGKTYTVTKVLALLQEQARRRDPENLLRILLLAPTGKAAQRLGESIKGNIEGDLRCESVIKDSIPREAATIHRALGFQPQTPTRFRHDAENPLPADVVLVDEASMVDVALMAKLVDAVPRHARLILLGDKDQLASVEAGAILGDIYGEGAVGGGADASEGYSEAFADQVKRVMGLDAPRSVTRPRSGIQDCRVHLTFSRRYAPGSGIERLATAVRRGDGDAAVAALRAHGDVAHRDLEGGAGLEAVLGPLLVEAFGTLDHLDPLGRFAALAKFRILCAHRQGQRGVEAINSLVERHLREQGCLRSGGEWYDGRPIMITENDYELGLFNGDLGVICPTEQGDSVDAVFIGQEASTLRRLPPATLPSHETVYAMTVHKSQGSEFERVALVLPEVESRVLTRELLYTGITRAKREVTVLGSEAVLRAGVGRAVVRASGLGEALWGDGSRASDGASS